MPPPQVCEHSCRKSTSDRDQPGAYFGFSTAGAGDVNGDGYSDVIVGANYYNTGLQNVGGAFIFFGSADGLSATADWEVEGDQAHAEGEESGMEVRLQRVDGRIEDPVPKREADHQATDCPRRAV